MKRFVILFAMLCVAFGCSQKEESRSEEKLPPESKTKFAPVEIPSSSAGLYSGMLPCDECVRHIVKMRLDSAGRVSIKEIFISEKTDSLESSATYKDSSGYILVRFDDGKRFFAFEKNAGTSLVYLNAEGKPYLDDTEEPYRLLRILNATK